MEAKNVNPQSPQSEVSEDEARASGATAPLTKDTASDFPATSNEGPKTLEEALDKIRALYKQEQAAKWGQGDQVNQVEEAHLAVRKGYQEARQWVEKELPEMDYQTLYRHASVAKYFSEGHTARWGVSKLQTLITLHDLKHRSQRWVIRRISRSRFLAPMARWSRKSFATVPGGNFRARPSSGSRLARQQGRSFARLRPRPSISRNCPRRCCGGRWR